jgi:hypothetical protein
MERVSSAQACVTQSGPARDAQCLLDLVNGRVGLLDVVVRETFAKLSVIVVVLRRVGPGSQRSFGP